MCKMFIFLVMFFCVSVLNHSSMSAMHSSSYEFPSFQAQLYLTACEYGKLSSLLYSWIDSYKSSEAGYFVSGRAYQGDSFCLYFDIRQTLSKGSDDQRMVKSMLASAFKRQFCVNTIAHFVALIACQAIFNARIFKKPITDIEPMIWVLRKKMNYLLEQKSSLLLGQQYSIDQIKEKLIKSDAFIFDCLFPAHCSLSWFTWALSFTDATGEEVSRVKFYGEGLEKYKKKELVRNLVIDFVLHAFESFRSLKELLNTNLLFDVTKLSDLFNQLPLTTTDGKVVQEEDDGFVLMEEDTLK